MKTSQTYTNFWEVERKGKDDIFPFWQGIDKGSKNCLEKETDLVLMRSS